MHLPYRSLTCPPQDDKFLCYVVSVRTTRDDLRGVSVLTHAHLPAQYTAVNLRAANTILHFLVHHDAARCQALLEAAGAWQAQLHEEILFFDDGHWQKSHQLWVEVQKAKWAEVILKEEFKEHVMDDVEGFFRSEDLYKSLSVPWKVSFTSRHWYDRSEIDMRGIARHDHPWPAGERQDHHRQGNHEGLHRAGLRPTVCQVLPAPQRRRGIYGRGVRQGTRDGAVHHGEFP